MFATSAFRKLSSIYVFSYFPFGFEGRIWDLIVSVPDHCLSFYFTSGMFPDSMSVVLLTVLNWLSVFLLALNPHVYFISVIPCPQDVKESAYKGLVRPVLEYGSSAWDPSSILLQEELEKVQKRAARFVTGNYLYETGSMTGILEQLKWESLKKRRRDSRIIMLYKGLKGAASIPTNDLVPPIRHVRNHHSLAFQTPFANTDIYKCSFFPQTIRDWNSLTDTFLSAAEGAEDSVAKFTSLVRARD